MALTENKKIAVWPTAKASCQMLWAARKQHVALALIVFLPITLLTFLVPYSRTTQLILSVFWIIFCLIPMQILWQRLFLVGPDLFLKVTAQKLLIMWLRQIGFYLGLVIAFTLAAIIFFAAWMVIEGLWHFAFHIAKFIALFGFATFCFLCVITLIRLAPIPVSISVEEHISLRKSWSMIIGNTARIWLTIFTLLLSSMLLVSFILLVIVGAIGASAAAIMGEETFLRSLMSPGLQGIVNLLLSPLFSIIPALQMAAMAIVYRDLVPQPEHLVDVKV